MDVSSDPALAALDVRLGLVSAAVPFVRGLRFPETVADPLPEDLHRHERAGGAVSVR